MRAKLERAIGAWRASLMAKVFTACFMAVHVPIIALTFYLALGRPADPMPVLAVALLATVAGTAVAFLAMQRLLRPLHAVVAGLRSYRTEAKVPEMPAERADEIGMVGAEVGKLIASLEGTLEKLRRQAYSDALTGLGNRRWLTEVAGAEIARARREEEPISVIAFDLDHFKRINDEFGHEVGDEVLVGVAEVARHHLRPYDMLARIGGEEFCAVLPQASLDVAARVAERIRAAVDALAFAGLPAGSVTASFGVHQGDAKAETLKGMIAAADKQLYAAKAAGRNQVAALSHVAGLEAERSDFEPRRVAVMARR